MGCLYGYQYNSAMRNWLLPEFIEDVMPAEAARIESLRRQLLDLFKVNGYQYVIPPTLEYVESLITGTGHASPRGLARTREPLQIGAELFGHAGVDSDVEIQRLMVKSLKLLGLNDLHVDFSHVGIFESLIEAGDIDSTLEDELYAALLSKDKTRVAELADGVDDVVKQALISLTDLNGDASVLARAAALLPALPKITKALDELETIADRLSDLDLQVGFDLSELRGYHYHSGVVFAAYAQNYAGPLALGGRYDEVGESFGRARPATGFSLDLRGIVTALSVAKLDQAILAPAGNEAALLEKVEALRADGQVVVQALPDDTTSKAELNCDRALKQMDGEWQVVPLTS